MNNVCTLNKKVKRMVEDPAWKKEVIRYKNTCMTQQGAIPEEQHS